MSNRRGSSCRRLAAPTASSRFLPSTRTLDWAGVRERTLSSRILGRLGDLDFLVGKTVTEIRDERRIVFIAGSCPAPDLYADAGTPEVLGSDGLTMPLAALVGRTVSTASADDGTLLLTFNDGSLLRCNPDPRYEAWEVVGGDPQSLVVCLPGGELAIWDKRHQVTRAEAEESVDWLNALLGWNVRLKEVRGSSFTVEPPDERS
jgi:Family of unknown function (DUF6188)